MAWYDFLRGSLLPPKVPQLQTSDWEKNYYQRLKDIVEGRAPGYTRADLEKQYQMQKEQILPETQRIEKRGLINFARRGISGGPVNAFEQNLGENELQQLIKARQLIEYQNKLLDLRRKMAALSGMGQVAGRKTNLQNKQKMLAYQQLYNEYQQLQNQLAQAMNIGGQVAMTAAMPEVGLPAMIGKTATQQSYYPIINRYETGYPSYGEGMMG